MSFGTRAPRLRIVVGCVWCGGTHESRGGGLALCGGCLPLAEAEIRRRLHDEVGDEVPNSVLSSQ